MGTQGWGLGAAVSEALALGREKIILLHPVCMGQFPWGLGLACLLQAHPRVWGVVVWAPALAVPLVLGPFSAAGKVPRGSPSALVALCWEIPTCWLIPWGWRGKPDVPYPVFAMHFLGPLMATSSFVCNENGGRVGSFHSVLSRRLRYDCPWRVVALSVCSYPDSE